MTQTAILAVLLMIISGPVLASSIQLQGTITDERAPHKLCYERNCPEDELAPISMDGTCYFFSGEGNFSCTDSKNKNGTCTYDGKIIPPCTKENAK